MNILKTSSAAITAASQLAAAAISLAGRKGKGSKSQGEFGKTTKVEAIDWSHPEIGSIQIELKDLKFGEVLHQKDMLNWRKINLGSAKPSKIELDFNFKLDEGVELIYALGNEVSNASSEGPVKPFIVPVTWKDGPTEDSDPIPVLAHGDEEDFQLYAINRKTGFIIHLDVSVVTRFGHFWLTIQEVTGAQAVWHGIDTKLAEYTSVVLGDKAYSLVPVYDQNCYDGFDPVASWNRSYPGRADKVLGYVAEFDAAIPAEEAAPGNWQPEWLPHVPTHLKGYQVAVVVYYNLTMGQGFVELKDGRKCFLHFKAILDEAGQIVAKQGDFPFVEGMKGCYVKIHKDPGKANPKVTALRLY